MPPASGRNGRSRMPASNAGTSTPVPLRWPAAICPPTAALAGRDLPPASVLAADRNLTALARQLKGAGAPGTLDQLRAQVYLSLLTGTSLGSLIPTGPADPGIAVRMPLGSHDSAAK